MEGPGIRRIFFANFRLLVGSDMERAYTSNIFGRENRPRGIRTINRMENCVFVSQLIRVRKTWTCRPGLNAINVIKYRSIAPVWIIWGKRMVCVLYVLQRNVDTCIVFMINIVTYCGSLD